MCVVKEVVNSAVGHGREAILLISCLCSLCVNYVWCYVLFLCLMSPEAASRCLACYDLEGVLSYMVHT